LYYAAKRNDESIIAYRKASEIMPAAIEPLQGIINPLATQKNGKN